jgi:hypothetical protein
MCPGQASASQASNVGSEEDDEQDHYGEHDADGAGCSSRAADPRANQVPAALGVRSRVRTVPSVAGMSGRMVNVVLLMMRRYVATASDMSSGMPVHACSPELVG